jgi:Zn-dependent protease with chaperone function
MRSALLMCLYALAVAWYSPALLARLSATGMSARLGLTTWLTAMASVLASMAIALQDLVSAAAAGWHLLAEAFCQSVTGHACPPPVYRSAIFEIPLAATALGAALAAAVLAWRYGRNVQRAQQLAHAHSAAALITGRRLPAAGGTVVLDVPQPAAYCVPGRPAAIVLTTGALALLEPEQLTAVIAHERAHLAGNHHLLVTLTRGLSAVLPGVPLFTRAQAEVTRLTEMLADDAAARHSGRPALVTALLALGTGAPVPARALAAAAGDVTARVQRLLQPASPSPRARNRLVLATVTILLAAGPGLLTWVAGPLFTRVVPLPW